MNPHFIPHNKRNFYSKRKVRKDEIYSWINYTFTILLSFTALLFIYYVWTLNIDSTQWYNIWKLETEKQKLLLQKELLDVQISNLESLSTIENTSNLNNIMEKVENPDFAVIKNNVSYAYNY